MEKTIKALLVFCAVLCVVPVFACTQDGNKNVTGAACSIKDLNNLEKNKNVQEKVMTPEREKDLRPVRLNQETPKSDSDCLLGTCLQKSLFGR